MPRPVTLSPRRPTVLLSLAMAAFFAGLGRLPASDDDVVAEDTSGLEACRERG